MTTPVIFRKWKDGEVIALFPTLPGGNSWTECNSYLHIGQHGSASLRVMGNDTKLAKPNEYKDLLDELIFIGYNDLKIYKRVQQWMDVERITENNNES